jgi:flagellar basal body-associated protein FliL
MQDASVPLDELIEQANEVPADESTGRKLPVKKIGIFAGIILVAAASAYTIAGMLATSETVEPATEDLTADELLAAEAQNQAPVTRPSTGKMYNLESIIVNLDDAGLRRYLKITMHFEIKNDEIAALLNENRVTVIDKLIVILSSKKLDEIGGYEQKTQLKREIRDEMNVLLNVKDAVQQVYFSEFMVQ